MQIRDLPPPNLIAAVIVMALHLLFRLGAARKWPRTVADVLQLTGAGKSETYKFVERLWEVLPTLIQSPGRPKTQQPGRDDDLPVFLAIRNFLAARSDAIGGTVERHSYTDDFRRFVVGLKGPGQPAEEMGESRLALLAGVPEGTLRQWLLPPELKKQEEEPPPPTTPQTDASAPASPPNAPGMQESSHVDPPTTPVAPDRVTTPAQEESTSTPSTVRAAHLQLIAELWNGWRGTFQDFCQQLRTDHRLPYGDTYIGDVLLGLGLRLRRRQLPIEAPWSSNIFRVLFPDAQWLADGTDVVIWWQGHRFVFNLEAVLDVASNAMMGIDVSSAESAKALHHAYEAAKITSGGTTPLALTLDNKPCNLSPDAREALKDTTVLPATPGRGQAKAPIEGAFGLLRQELPPLVVTGSSEEELAGCVLSLILTAYFRGRSGRPRKRLGGRTPLEHRQHAQPTPEDIEEARRWIQELDRRQERARLTREARLDPVRLQLLKTGLAELGIPDPDDRLAKSLAYFSRDAIADGLARFETRQGSGTLPPDPANHGAYLGGIIRKLHTRYDLERLSVHIMKQRLRLRDFTLAPLTRAQKQLRAALPVLELPQAFIDHALEAPYAVDLRFWTQAATEALHAIPAAYRRGIHQALVRRIAASFKVERERREDLITSLAEAMAIAA